MEATAATATGKRKRAATDTTGDDPAPAAVDEASDAEVEEFYAILRRMRDASRRICGAGARPAPRAPAWRPSFCWEDFAPPPPPPTPSAQQARPDEPAAADRAAPPPPVAPVLLLWYECCEPLRRCRLSRRCCWLFSRRTMPPAALRLVPTE